MTAQHSHPDRLPPLSAESMTDAQREAAAALATGPRGGVRGPFIPLLRSPELMDRLQRVGEYLRYRSSVPTRINEFVILIVSRHWTQQFEWAVHHPLALAAGIKPEALEALAAGSRPLALAEDEAIAYDFTAELLRTHGVCDATYRRALVAFGEQGVVDLIGLIGYFTTVSMVMNVAHTPPPDSGVPPLAAFPL